MSATFLQAPNGDYALDENMRLILEEDQLVVAGIKLRNMFLFFEGTWYLDTTEGFPYFRYVFVKNPDLSFIARLYTRVILSVGSVIESVDRIDCTLDKKTRKLSVFFVAKSVDGRVLTGGPGEPFRINGKDI